MTDSAKRSWVTDIRPMGARTSWERDGYRPLMNDEADSLSHGQRVAVIDQHTCALYHGKVFSIEGAYVNVELDRTRAVIPLDLDKPHPHGYDDHLVRKPPTSDDGQFVMVTNAPYPPPAELFDALRASLEFHKLRKEVKALRNQIEELRALVGPKAVA